MEQAYNIAKTWNYKQKVESIRYRKFFMSYFPVLGIQINWIWTRIQNFGIIFIRILGYVIIFCKKNLKIILEKHNFLFQKTFF